MLNATFTPNAARYRKNARKLLQVPYSFQDIETGEIQFWKTKPAPDLAIRYWALKVRS